MMELRLEARPVWLLGPVLNLPLALNLTLYLVILNFSFFKIIVSH